LISQAHAHSVFLAVLLDSFVCEIVLTMVLSRYSVYGVYSIGRVGLVARGSFFGAVGGSQCVSRVFLLQELPQPEKEHV